MSMTYRDLLNKLKELEGVNNPYPYGPYLDQEIVLVEEGTYSADQFEITNLIKLAEGIILNIKKY